MKRILIIDNNDSFTYNLVEMFRQTMQCTVEVCLLEDFDQNSLEQYDGFILSPGPGLPTERKNLNGVIESILLAFKPLLGVCLGHQAIAQYFDVKIIQLQRIIHGEASAILLNEDALFTGLSKEIEVGRYHSWVVDKTSLSSELELLAETKSGLVMAYRHKNQNVRGVQFHPESVLTPKGKDILCNWLTFCVLP